MSNNQSKKTFLFSVDLEDVRLGVVNGESYKERVPININKYLNWLNKHRSKCTFFTTGHVAKKYPSLINEIVSEEHEYEGFYRVGKKKKKIWFFHEFTCFS